MIIDEKKHFITIPRDEYENLKKIIDEFNVNTITINCVLHVDLRSRYDIYLPLKDLTEPISYQFSSTINSSLPQTQIKIIEKEIIDEIVKNSIKEAIKNEKKITIYLTKELSKIKSKWWYKLFNR